MNLGKNINNLLKRYAEVYVMGLGVFKRKHSAAQFDKQRDLFLPPISYVEFDSTAESGFNFIHYIQQQQNLNLDAATQVLQDAVADLKDQLIQNGQAKLEDLGHIVSYGSSLVFKPLDLSGFNFEPIRHVIAPEIETVIPDRELEENIPFSPTELEEPVEDIIEDEPADTEQVEEEIVPETVVVTPSPVEIPVAPIIHEPVSETIDERVETDPAVFYQERSTKSNTVWYYISAAIIIVVSVIVAFLLNPSLKDQLFGKKQATAPVVVPAPVDTLPKIDSIQLKQDSTAIVDSLKVDTAALQTTLKETVVVKESVPVAQPNYQLVIATPKTMELAEEEVQRLRKKGYQTVRAVDSKFKRNKKRVIWDTYMTKEEADRDQATVAKTFSGAWVEKIAK
ncbi:MULTISPECIES: SPOR domain-containing protein [unclassified Sphingobacterium]|uniref:SPOR domain-containing protein n=1 Tax=unclassified Sphingobacterium TaxID=2609468 RepID=UPI001043D84C|nr:MULTISPECIES: SPOR domain-containing protein [unclassified Sphingobacterium]MCS3553069.1 nucleoid DNA-binding protein [Sphingobacterium sp. JUb21]TCR09721.1 sporulation related protein [Sphingobacterium sp. JUb20]